MVPSARIELATSALPRMRSTTELRRPKAGAYSPRQVRREDRLRRRPFPLTRALPPGHPSAVTLPIIKLTTPGGPSAELVAYYDEFATYYAQAEPDTRAWCVTQVKRDWVCFDVGANVGTYATLLSALAGRVHAFEPTETAEMLRANLAHNKCANVDVHQIALGRDAGALEESIFRIWGKDPERKTYPFATVDQMVRELNLERLDLLKIDVDSFDFEVLQGAVETLKRFNPYIIVELNHALAKRNQTVNAALAWLSGQGYDGALVLDEENFILKRGEQRATAPTFSLWMSASEPEAETALTDARLGPALSHNGATLSDAPAAPAEIAALEGFLPIGLRLKTAPDIWSFALSFDLNEIPTGPALRDLAIEAHYELVSGRVGIGALGADWKDYVAKERDAEPGRAAVTVRFQDAADTAALMFRNTSPSGQPSEIILHGVRVLRRRGDAGAIDRLARDVAQGARIAIADLASAATQFGEQEQA